MGSSSLSLLAAATLLTALMGCGQANDVAVGDHLRDPRHIATNSDFGGPKFFIANRSGSAVAIYDSATGRRLDQTTAPKGMEIDQISSVTDESFVFSAVDKIRAPHLYRAVLTSAGSVSHVMRLPLPTGITPANVALAISRSGSKLAYVGGFAGDGSAGTHLTVRDLSNTGVHKFTLQRKTHSWISNVSWASDEDHLAMTVLSPCKNSPPDGEACTGDVSVRVLDSTSTDLDISNAPEVARNPAWGTATQNPLRSYVSGPAVLSSNGSAAYVPLSIREKDGHRATLVQEISSTSGKPIRELGRRPAGDDWILSLAIDESGRYLIARFPTRLQRIRLSDGVHSHTSLEETDISQVAW